MFPDKHSGIIDRRTRVPDVRPVLDLAMRLSIIGETGGASVRPETEWPFDFPPKKGMNIDWRDSNTNEHRSKIELVVFDLTRGDVMIAVSSR
jgi:hypothetical protein